jgi:hypothetical protein
MSLARSDVHFSSLGCRDHVLVSPNFSSSLFPRSSPLTPLFSPFSLSQVSARAAIKALKDQSAAVDNLQHALQLRSAPVLGTPNVIITHTYKNKICVMFRRNIYHLIILFNFSRQTSMRGTAGDT